MPKHDFSDLLTHYPDIIKTMPKTFTSHEFILALAQQHQKPYIEALYAYRDSIHRGAIAPFRAVHQYLSRRLHDFDHLITHDGIAYSSRDIFGNTQRCAKWRRKPEEYSL
jgi:hypothetical protein